MYGTEAWVVKKVQEKRLDVVELRMLRWICGVARLDRIRNEITRVTTKMGEIAKTGTEEG